MSKNVWDEGKWAAVNDVNFDFMTMYIFEKLIKAASFQDKRVLELGCGTGRLSYLALKAGAKNITLVDSSLKAVALARGLFATEEPQQCSIIQSDIFEYEANERYDLVFSSGLIEHFQGADRARIVKKHLDMSLGDCLIIHPSDTLYASVFNRLPQAIKLYGFQQSFSENEISRYLMDDNRVKSFANMRFHPFYTVPVLHNCEMLNRAIDRVGGGKSIGGLTLTSVRLAIEVA